MLDAYERPWIRASTPETSSRTSPLSELDASLASTWLPVDEWLNGAEKPRQRWLPRKPAWDRTFSRSGPDEASTPTQGTCSDDDEAAYREKTPEREQSSSRWPPSPEGSFSCASGFSCAICGPMCFWPWMATEQLQ